MPKDRGSTTGLAIPYIVPGDGDPRHGTENGYGNLRCRCTACRGAHADYIADKKRDRWLPPDDPRHGTCNGYGNYNCRCTPCTDAHNEYKRDYNARKRGGQ